MRIALCIVNSIHTASDPIEIDNTQSKEYLKYNSQNQIQNHWKKEQGNQRCANASFS